MPTTAEMLAFEARWEGRRRGGAKEEAIRAQFGIPPAAYYQRLHRALDTREALEHDALLVHRLQGEADRLAARRVARLAG